MCCLNPLLISYVLKLNSRLPLIYDYFSIVKSFIMTKINFLLFTCRGNDAYIVLASHVLHSAWVKSGDSSYLVEALALLERALACSPANFHFKLLLVRLYTLLGKYKLYYFVVMLITINLITDLVNSL